MDWSALALALERCNAAYVEGDWPSKAAFEQLGDTWLGQYADSGHQAVLTKDKQGQIHLTISGTRASQWNIIDILEDASLTPKAVKGGQVTNGVYDGMDIVWDWVWKIIPKDTKLVVGGHSLGASRTHLTPLFLPAEQIVALYSFEAPKFCDAEYYTTYKDLFAAKMICVLNGRDSWAAWPWLNTIWKTRPQQQHVWLHDGTYSMIDPKDWPGFGKSSDHFTDSVMASIGRVISSFTPVPK